MLISCWEIIFFKFSNAEKISTSALGKQKAELQLGKKKKLQKVHDKQHYTDCYLSNGLCFDFSFPVSIKTWTSKREPQQHTESSGVWECPTTSPPIRSALSSVQHRLKISVFGKIPCLHPDLVLSLEPGSAFSAQTKTWQVLSFPNPATPAHPLCPSQNWRLLFPQQSIPNISSFHQCVGAGVPFFGLNHYLCTSTAQK